MRLVMDIDVDWVPPTSLRLNAAIRGTWKARIAPSRAAWELGYAAALEGFVHDDAEAFTPGALYELDIVCTLPNANDWDNVAGAYKSFTDGVCASGLAVPLEDDSLIVKGSVEIRRGDERTQYRIFERDPLTFPL